MFQLCYKSQPPMRSIFAFLAIGRNRGRERGATLGMQLDPGRNRGATPAARAAFALEQHARLIGTADAKSKSCDPRSNRRCARPSPRKASRRTPARFRSPPVLGSPLAPNATLSIQRNSSAWRTRPSTKPRLADATASNFSNATPCLLVRIAMNAIVAGV
jgi:hypothetical protein